MSRSDHPFAFRDFRLFWVARLSATLAQNCLVVVIGWQVYELARRTMGMKAAALQLGFVGLAQFVPLFALTLVTGWAADRVDRRKIACASIALQAVCGALLCAITATGHPMIKALIAVACLLGVARAFSMPALNALAPNLVPIEVLPRAIASSAIGNRIGGIGGPALGGYLYAAGAPLPYAASLALFLLALLCTLLIRPLARTAAPSTQNPWRQMVEGLHYVWSNRLVLGAISLDLFAVLLGGATAMLPVYAHDILKTGPSGLGDLRAAPAVGAMLSAVWFSHRPLKHHVGLKMLIAVIVFGAATVIFGLSHAMALSLVALATLGAADMFSVYVRQSLIQISTPDHMRGRVGAVSSLFISASNELGEMESGFAAALIGPVPAVVAGGIGAIVVTLVWAKLFPALRQAMSFESVATQPPPPVED